MPVFNDVEADDLSLVPEVDPLVEHFKQLLDQLVETVPEAYAEENHYILDYRIQIALMEGNEADVERYFYQFSPLAGDQLDLYYRVISSLAYHGKQEILWPHEPHWRA